MPTVTPPASTVDEAIPTSRLPTEIERRTGVRPSHHTCMRWMLAGVRGRRLASYLIGARRYVRASSLDAFLAPRESAA